MFFFFTISLLRLLTLNQNYLLKDDIAFFLPVLSNDWNNQP